MNKPNLLVFMTDQQRWDTAPPFTRAVTPYLDALAAEGVTFSGTYCPSPHCCPSRATFFTGLYPTEHGVWNNVQVANALSRGLNPGVKLFSDDLRDAGYELYFSGKWHVSSLETPADRGWQVNGPQEQAVTESKLKELRSKREWDQYRRIGSAGPGLRADFEIQRPGYGTFTISGVDESPFRDRETVDEALQWFAERKNRPEAADASAPWCQFVGTLGPHDPYRVPQKYLDLYPDPIPLPENFYDRMTDKPAMYRRIRALYDQLSPEEHQEAMRHYLAFCSYQDALFGEILAALEASGEADNTVVLYVSDHGDYMAEHGIWAKGLPCFEAAYRVPAVMRWPQGIVNPGRDVDAFVSLADFAPTFLELAGLSPDRSFTGSSLVPFLKDEAVEDWRDAIFTQSNGNEQYGIQRSVTTDQWKYVYNGFDFDELYDRWADPEETTNLADNANYRPVIRDLCRRMWQFAYDHNDTCINSYIMVGLAPYGPGIIFDEPES